MSTIAQPLTGEQVLAMGDIGRWELIYGKVVKMSPSGFMHAQVSAQVAWLLTEWNRQDQRGVVLGAEGGFRLSRNPDLLRAPDAAYVDAKRVGPESPSGFFEGAPDLAVEVVSPGDSWSELESKVEMWLAHGCRSCWVVNPQTRQVSVYRGDGTVLKLKETQDLTDEVLPGFRVHASVLFER
jgi:Uma2 family endonuclease